MLIAAGRARQHHQQCAKGSSKRITVQDRAASPSTWFLPFSWTAIRAAIDSQVWWRFRVLLTKERVRYGIAGEPARRVARGRLATPPKWFNDHICARSARFFYFYIDKKPRNLGGEGRDAPRTQITKLPLSLQGGSKFREGPTLNKALVAHLDRFV